MDPVETEKSNFTYLGPGPDVGDLPCERRDGGVFSTWELTPEERELIAAGGRIELGVYVEPIPPVSLAVVG